MQDARPAAACGTRAQPPLLTVPCTRSPPPRPPCRVIYLEDNDIVHMKGGEYTVFNWSDVDSPSVEVRRTIQTLTMEVSQIMKVRGPPACQGEGLQLWATALVGCCQCCSQRPAATRLQPPAHLAARPPHPAPRHPCQAGRLHALHGEGDL